MKNLLLILVVSITTWCSAQIIPVAGVNQAFTLTPSQVTNFYDASGPGGAPCATGTTASGSYPNCGCFTRVRINAAPGEFLIVSFNEFAMWNTATGWDWMRIFDGPNLASPLLFDNSNGGADNPMGDCGIGANILDYCSTGNSMTFEFYATSVVNRAGWDATVSSVPSACLPLPIELIHFSATNTNDVNELSWGTKSELDNDYYIIERSTDGFLWDILGNIDGAGNSQAIINYKFIDEEYRDVVNYYRLTQVNLDGLQQSYDVKAIDNRKEGKHVKTLEYYSMLGTKIPKPESGLVVVKTTYTDGEISTKKVFLQQE